MSTERDTRWKVRRRKLGTVHIVWYYEVCCGGTPIDIFTDDEMARALARFRNERSLQIGTQ